MCGPNIIRWGLFLLGVAAAGCADGPFGLARYNPVLRDEWKKDEQYGPTMHQRIEEMQAWARQGAKLPPAEQQRVAQQLNAMVQSEGNPLLVMQAVRTLGEIPAPEALEGLRSAVTHSDADVRRVACEAWRRKGGSEALATLGQVVNSDTDADVRIVAARELGTFRDPQAIHALALVLEDPNPALQHRAVESLKYVTGKDYGDDVAAWREFVSAGHAKPAAEVSWAQRILTPWR